MRITVLHPDPARADGLVATDVDIDAGTPIGLARPHLARVTGWAGWTSDAVRPAVGERALGVDHRAGTTPLVPGAVLRPWPAPAVADPLALARSGPHVAVVAGRGTGTVVPLGRGRSAPVPGLLTRRAGRLVLARVEGHAWRPWRRGTAVRTTTSVAVLRGPAADEEAATRDRTPEPAAPTGSRAPWLGPAVGAVALGLALREPLLALVGLVGPAGALMTRRRPRRRTPAAHRPPGTTDDLAALAVATARAVEADGPVRRVDPAWGAEGSLAVVGPRATALAAARALVLGAVGTHGDVEVVVRSAAPGDWRWTRWLLAEGSPDRRGAATSVLHVLDDPARTPTTVCPDAARPNQRLLVVAGHRSVVPAWCTAIVDVAPGQSSTPQQLVDEAWAQEQARRVAAVRHRARTGAAPVPPAVPLGALPGVPAPTAGSVARSWAAPRSAVPVGTRAGGGPAIVDLRRDGPHALVAGTTGSGKSELLTTLVLAHALTHPPDRLAVLLVDFKGGTGLGALAALPHVVGHVTDLDAALARRVLVGLAAELRRRERAVARRGARDLAELDPDDPATPARLLVVVDELRALADDVPDAMPTLARLAAQGRALGVHLVLATQRPAGAVPADLRANLGLRICLRVADPADSLDVVDVPDAATLDPGRPGAALMRVGGAAPVAVQVARAVPGGAAPVRLAVPWSASTWSPARASTAAPGPRAWLEAATVAARGRGAATTPWLGPLPDVVHARDLPPGPGLPLALADRPDEQRRVPLRWDAGEGHLLVVGGPGSGRSTTLLALAAQADRAGHAVHAIGLPSAARERLPGLVPHAGTVLGTGDTAALARLLERLAPTTTPTLLVLDGIDVALDELATLARGAGADRLLGLLRATPPGLAIAASTGATPTASRLAAAFRTRLVLPVPDPTTDLLLGVPRDLAEPRRVPGRAVHLVDGDAVLCQVATVPPANPPANPPADPQSAAAAPRGPVVVPLPRSVRATRHGPAPHAGPAGASPVVPLGLGGDDARELLVDLGRTLVVAGPPGSGRSHALDVLATGATRVGMTVVALDARRPPGPGELLVVDDLDDLERADPGSLALLDSLDHHVVVATTSASALGAYRGTLAALLRRRRTLVLDPADLASAELVGPRATWFVDRHGCPPGRGVLVEGRTLTPVQVYAEVTTDRRGPSDRTSRHGPTAGTAR